MSQAISPATQPSAPGRWPWLAALALLLLPWAAYWPAVHAGYIWDDDFHVYDSPLLRDVAGLWRIWTDPVAQRQYYPLTHFSFWLEYRLWGTHPLGYHVDNLLLHGLNALLLWRVLRRLLPHGAWIAALLFAVHPVHVESVVWVTERKNTLSMLFALLAVLSWLRFEGLLGTPPSPRDKAPTRRWGLYALALACFVLAMLAKTVVAVLPAALLLVLLWQRGRDVARGALLALLPWFALGVGLGLFSVHMEHAVVGAKGGEFALTLYERLLLAGRTPWFYAAKLAWPQPLIFIYERWPHPAAQVSAYLGYALASLLAVGALTAWSLRRLWRGERLPGAAVAVGVFLVLLLPAGGLFNVFPFRYAFVADHFQYHASVALLAAAGWGLAELERRLRLHRPALRLLAPVLSSFLALQCAALAVAQSRVYFSNETLWVDTIQKNPGAAIAWNNLGTFYAERGDLPRALAILRPARQQFPADHDIQLNLAQVLALAGEYEAAAAEAQALLAAEPRDPDALAVLGQVAQARGEWDQAEHYLATAAALRPTDATFRTNLQRLREARAAGRPPQPMPPAAAPRGAPALPLPGTKP